MVLGVDVNIQRIACNSDRNICILQKIEYDAEAAFLTSKPGGTGAPLFYLIGNCDDFLCRHAAQQGLYRFRKSKNWRKALKTGCNQNRNAV